MFYTVIFATIVTKYIAASFIVTWLGLRSNILFYSVPRICVQLADLSQLSVLPAACCLLSILDCKFTHPQLLVFIASLILIIDSI